MAPNTEIFWGGEISSQLEQKHSVQVKEGFHLSTWQQTKPHVQISHQLRQNQDLYPGLSQLDKLWGLINREVCGQRDPFSVWERGGEDKSWLQMAETYPAVSSKRCSPLYNQDFSFSIFNALSKISCLSFLPFSSLPHHPNENVKKKINFDLIGFHFSLQGNKN